MVQQRQAEVGGDEESEADERLAALLAVAGQRAALVWKVKKLVASNRTRPRSTSKSRTMRVTRSIPGMASRGTRLFQNRWLVRRRKRTVFSNHFAVLASDATVGDQQVGADGRSVALFGNVPGGLRDAGVGREGGDGAEVTHQGFDGIAGHDGDDSVGRTEILLPGWAFRRRVGTRARSSKPFRGCVF